MDDAKASTSSLKGFTASTPPGIQKPSCSAALCKVSFCLNFNKRVEIQNFVVTKTYLTQRSVVRVFMEARSWSCKPFQRRRSSFSTIQFMTHNIFSWRHTPYQVHRPRLDRTIIPEWPVSLNQFNSRWPSVQTLWKAASKQY